LIELATLADRLPVARPAELSWLERGGTSLVEAVRALPLPDTPGFAYIAGEAQACAALRRHFVEERGGPARSAIAVKPFWTPGKRGLE
jgi:NADPH-dependent ferric siderophore reductase